MGVIFDKWYKILAINPTFSIPSSIQVSLLSPSIFIFSVCINSSIFSSSTRSLLVGPSVMFPCPTKPMLVNI